MPLSNSRLSVFIGLRYITSGRSDGFGSFVSVFSFLAMSLGVMVLILVLSVMNGFDREIKTRLLEVIPHATLHAPHGLQDWQLLASTLERPELLASIPYIEGQAMLTSGSHFQGVSVQGVLPDASNYPSVSGPRPFAAEVEKLQAGTYGVVLGALLARSLDVEVGDRLLLTLPELSVTPLGVFPRVKQVTVLGVFQVGAQIDSGVAFMHLNDLGRLLRMGSKVSGLRLFFDDPFAMSGLSSLRADISAQGYQIETWQQSMAQLFQAIRTEKTVVGLLLSVIIGVAAFNIVASLVLMVNEKRKDIAVLRSLGMMPATIAAIFRTQGGVTGVLGVACGVIAACLLAPNIGAVLAFFEALVGAQMFDPELYFITVLPSHLQWADVIVVGTLGVVLSVLATLYPAWRAGKVPPAEALRYE
ncbi:MAG: lipoprotein-releasing ABC transporter permease subunit [Gammaproteobacteria bacterium]|nr:lipoprotein-releasing ABC transporter permease subunit [Gammaproteobacteria bacterium]MBQ0838719.1 lipoprotein-releasing ABC transporter permease subunit [Gammaproteobacteria bacterium]